MRILGIDFETTGLDLKNDRIVEIGAALFDTDRSAPLVTYSQYVYEMGYPKLSQEIVALTGIRQEDLNTFGRVPAEAFIDLIWLMNQADVIMAHNGKGFDFPLLRAEFDRHGVMASVKEGLLYVDSAVDVPYPRAIQTRKLSYLAAEHGFANPFAHRALFDVLTMQKVIKNYAWDEVLSLANQKDILIRAVVTFEEKDKARERGYRWNAERKFWLKTVKENQVGLETVEAPFKIQILEF